MSPAHQYSAVTLVEDPDEHEGKSRSRLRSDARWDVFGPVAWLFTTFILTSVLVLLVATYTKVPTREACVTPMMEWCESSLAIL